MATACNIKRGWSTTALVVCQYQRTTASLPAGCFGSSVIAHWRHFSGMQQPQHRPSRDNDWQLLIKTDTQQQRRIRRVSLIFSQRYLSSCPSVRLSVCDALELRVNRELSAKWTDAVRHRSGPARLWNIRNVVGPISRFISKTIKHTAIVTTADEQASSRTVYDLSNSAIFNDLEWPLT